MMSPVTDIHPTAAAAIIFILDLLAIMPCFTSVLAMYPPAVYNRKEALLLMEQTNKL